MSHREYPALAPCLLLALASASCATARGGEGLDYRAEMRGLVGELSAYARARREGFLVIPQNGQELATADGSAAGEVMEGYLASIDGCGREDLFYGYEEDDEPTKAEDSAYLRGLCEVFRDRGKTVLAIDYCSTPARVDDTYERNEAARFVSFAADHRELDDIPARPSVPHNANSGDVASLPDARNFLYLINPQSYASKEDYLEALRATDYDLLVLDLFFDGVALSAEEVSGLKAKAGGGSRLVACYLSIGEAEDYRYYWEASWAASPPAWLGPENPAWEGNYEVRYWEPAWKTILYGSEGAYLDRILAAGFDGAYLDLVDAFEYFEALPRPSSPN